MKTYLKNIIKKISPVPGIFLDGEEFDGIIVKRCKQCQTCIDRVCMQSSIERFICPYGFKRINFNYDDERIIFLGFITHNSKNKLNNQLKNKKSTIFLSDENIESWISNLTHVINLINQETIKYLETLHDITPTINQIIRHAEILVQSTIGKNFNEKFDNCNEDLKSLYKSAEILSKNLQFMSFIANPQSISYGNKHSTDIYKLLDKFTRTFSAIAERKRIHIKLIKDTNNVINKPKVNVAFGILIFVLLENAIKYSQQNQDIVIKIKDIEKGGIYVDIISYGPIVPEQYQKRIFEKEFRYIPQKEEEDKIPGHGLGLYIGEEIAKAHNFNIEYKSDGNICSKDGVKLGDNHFILRIP